jgi:hypothetical protein
MQVPANTTAFKSLIGLADNNGDPILGIPFDHPLLTVQVLLHSSATWQTLSLIAGSVGVWSADSWVEIGEGVYQICLANSYLTAGQTTGLRIKYSTNEPQIDVISCTLPAINSNGFTSVATNSDKQGYALSSIGLLGVRSSIESSSGLAKSSEKVFRKTTSSNAAIDATFDGHPLWDLSTGHTVRIYNNDALLSPQPTITATATTSSYRYQLTVPANITLGTLTAKLETTSGTVLAQHGYDVENPGSFPATAPTNWIAAASIQNNALNDKGNWAKASDVTIQLPAFTKEEVQANNTLTFFNNETYTRLISILDEKEEIVDQTGRTAKFVLEAFNKEDLIVQENIAGTAQGYNVNITPIPFQERAGQWSLRLQSTGQVIISGCAHFKYAAEED